jgi:hypothetical protein
MAPGLSVSPQSLGRGKVSRSNSVTRAPARASSVAHNVPAGPAPAMITSDGTQHQRGVLRPEAEAVAQCGGRPGGTTLIR